MEEETGQQDPTFEEIEVEATPSGAGPAETQPGLNVGVLAFLGVILVLVAVSNVWLRRRAQRENAAADEPTPQP